VLLSCTVEEAASRDRHRSGWAGGHGTPRISGKNQHPLLIGPEEPNLLFVRCTSAPLPPPPASTTAHQRLNALPSPPLSPAPARPSARQTLRLCQATTAPLPCGPAPARPVLACSGSAAAAPLCVSPVTPTGSRCLLWTLVLCGSICSWPLGSSQFVKIWSDVNL
jgi:hypothetical protein